MRMLKSWHGLERKTSRSRFPRVLPGCGGDFLGPKQTCMLSFRSWKSTCPLGSSNIGGGGWERLVKLKNLHRAASSHT